ncbi:30888_t:CDS:2 [Gigaspora margarita]|uniref:30888_t:CDS:1 n=1 Tax=Gigaspora margarita TaxID=4874 RepID=A0ABN7VHJ0_GIGMA|nr:30888_t:CDS:2 [Gigaspora margarita]
MGTKEYLDLGKSGKVWENYFCPFEWRAQDYDFYVKNSSFLDEISVIKDTIEIPTKDLFQRMIVNFSHQSCIIKGNSLGSAESQIIWEKMNQDYNIDDLQHEDAQLPEPKSLLDKAGKEIEIVEIRNHLLATHYLYYTLLKSEQEINIDNIKKIHRTLLKDTPQERINVWGKIQKAGMFRTVSMQAVGYHLTVYPYGEEVPALTERFVQFYKTVTGDNDEPYQIHPLMNACRILSSFLHIHPFYDGNGRVGLSLMALYLARGGFPPLVFQQLDRKEYADALYKAQAEKDMNPFAPKHPFRLLIAGTSESGKTSMVVHLLLGSKYPKIYPWMSGEKRGHKIPKGGSKAFGERYIPCNNLIVVVQHQDEGLWEAIQCFYEFIAMDKQASW